MHAANDVSCSIAALMLGACLDTGAPQEHSWALGQPPRPTVSSPARHFVTTPPAAAMSDDGYVVAWTERGREFAPFFQRYDRRGAPVGAVTRASPSDSFVVRTPAVAMSAVGELAVAFTDVDPSFAVQVQRYRADGSPRGAPQEVSGDSFVVGVPTVAMNEAGRAVVGWADRVDFHPYFRYLDVDGAPESIVLASGASQLVWAPAVALDAAGHVVAAWTDGLDYQVHYGCWDADGQATHPPEVVSTGVIEVPPTIVMEGSGRFVIGWGVSAQAFDSCGSPSGDPVIPGPAVGPITIEKWIENGETLGPDHASAITTGGSFSMAWTLETGLSRPSFDVFAQVFDAQGVALTPAQQVTRHEFVDLPPAAGAAPHGPATVLAWTRGDTFQVEHVLLSPP